MTTTFSWETLITIIRPNRKKCPALRITGANSEKGQFITLTFCLYENQKLQTILHLPFSQATVWHALFTDALELLEYSHSPHSTGSLEEAAKTLGISFLPRETEILDHKFKRTKPVEKFYPFEKLLGGTQCDARSVMAKEPFRK